MRKIISIKTEKQFTDITELVQKAVTKSGISKGIVNVFTRHTTCGIKIMEDELLSFADILTFMDNIIPNNRKYNHDLVGIREVPPDERVNGCSHVRMLFFPSNITIPVDDFGLMLGEWQHIFLVEMDWDMPFRDRTIVVTVIPIMDA